MVGRSGCQLAVDDSERLADTFLAILRNHGD